MRSLLSVLGIVFGIAAVISMMAMAEGAKREILEQISHLGADSIILRATPLTGSQKKDAGLRGSRGLSDSDIASVEKMLPSVNHSSALREVPSRIASTTGETVFPVFSVKPSFAELRGLHLRQGRFICDIDEGAKQRVCVIGNEVAAGLGMDGRVGGTVLIEGIPFKVVGILSNRNYVQKENSTITARNFNRAVLLPVGTEPAEESRAGGYTDIIFRFSSSRYIKSGAAVIRQIVLTNHGGFEDFQTIVPVELLNQANRTQRTFNTVLGITAVITLLVGGIGIMNIMTASVTERTREIGIRRAVGANQLHIVIQFLTESTLLTLIGGIIGFFTGAAGALVVELMTRWPVVITGWSVCVSLIVSAVTGICFGLYPAYRAARMNPVDALRY
jgi:putative ABC transport system permease protein